MDHIRSDVPLPEINPTGVNNDETFSNIENHIPDWQQKKNKTEEDITKEKKNGVVLSALAVCFTSGSFGQLRLEANKFQ